MALGTQVVAASSHGCQSILHAVVSEVLPRKHRPLAQVAINVACGTGAIVAIYVGGALVRTNPMGFRNYWYMLSGLYFVGATLVLIFYRPMVRQEQKLSTKEKIDSLDLPAMFLIVASLLTLCVGLGYANNPYPWSNAIVLAPFLVGIVCACALAVYSIFYHKQGLLNHRLYQTRNFAIAQSGVLAEGIAFLAVNNYFGFQVSLFYNEGLFRTGLVYSIVWYSYLVAAVCVGIYCSKTRTVRLPALLAFTCFVIYFVVMATTTASTPLSQLWGLNVLCGFGLGLSLNPLVVVAQLSTPPDLISTATGLLIATRALGASIGLAIYNSIFNSTLSDNLASRVLGAVASFGLPESSQLSLVQALISNDSGALAEIPGMTPEIIQAGLGGMMDAYALGFRNVYITAGCFSFLALVCKCRPGLTA